MAISRFQQASGSTNLSAFYQWLITNKAGTFLENVTIVNTTASHTNDRIVLSSANSDVYIDSAIGDGAAVLQFVSGSLTFVARTEANAYAEDYITGALLCNKGLIIQFYGQFAAGSNYNNAYGVCITVDNNGELAIISTTGAIPTSTTEITTWVSCAAGSTSTAQRNCRPFFQANLTSLAPITAQGTDTELRLPYAYAAISTQLNQEGLYPIVIDGKQYITNGVWYIKDGD